MSVEGLDLFGAAIPIEEKKPRRKANVINLKDAEPEPVKAISQDGDSRGTVIAKIEGTLSGINQQCGGIRRHAEDIIDRIAKLCASGELSLIEQSELCLLSAAMREEIDMCINAGKVALKIQEQFAARQKNYAP